LGCKIEVGPYNSEIKNLFQDYFWLFFRYNIGSRGCRFYCPNHTTSIIESDRVIYLEGNSGDDSIMQPRIVEFR